MSDAEFDQIVTKAIEAVPEPYADRLGEINFVVEDEPTPQQRQQLGLRSCDALFGLYEGIPLTQRNGMLLAKVPDVITVFRHPMIEMFPETNALRQQIGETIWHEVAHFYGLNHARIHALQRKKHENN